MPSNYTEHEKHYTHILWILLGVFAISIVGSYIGLPQWAVQIIVFGVALVKAFYVIKHFMHLPQEAGVMIASVSAPLILIAVFLILIWPDFGYVGTNMEYLK